MNNHVIVLKTFSLSRGHLFKIRFYDTVPVPTCVRGSETPILREAHENNPRHCRVHDFTVCSWSLCNRYIKVFRYLKEVIKRFLFVIS